MKKILFVFGTRPEAIKMAPVVKEFQKFSTIFQTLICVTAQHREMLDQVLKIFDIIPDFDLNIMKKGQDLYDVTSRVLLGMKDVLITAKPDIVLIHGDTTTSIAAALAAFYQQIPVGHIEAGLRTYNMYSPYPEEINRQLASRIATYNFAPTLLSQNNLILEGIRNKSIMVTGNSVIDALFLVLDKLKKDPNTLQNSINALKIAGIQDEKIKLWGNKKRKFILITGHRRENFGEGILNICNAIKKLAENYPSVDFVYPMHLNPNIRMPIAKIFGNVNAANVLFIEPLDYIPFVYLMSLSSIVLTDSGGIQEEAPSLGKPVLVMRDTTERPEAVEAGTVKLIGTEQKNIIESISELLDNPKSYEQMANAVNPYGDGFASKRIVEYFIENL